MSGRNRRRTPPPVDEVRERIRGLVRSLMVVDVDYRWLHASGYTPAHARAGQLGDPSDLLTGDAATARHLLIRAAEALDDATDALQLARAALGRIETKIDEGATPGGVDEDLPTASSAEVRQARRQQAKRAERALPGGAPWANDEVTG